MSLTTQQIADVRYFMGYSVTGNSAYSAYRELVYSNVSYMGIALDDPTGAGGRLQNLSPEEESRITGFFLPNLVKREQEIQDTSQLVSNAKAGPWERNPADIGERRALFNSLRLDLCGFLGFPPGANVTRSSHLVRG